MALKNYVKFIRGTPEAFKNLTIKDNDTLYFIKASDSTVGRLYLGNILVAGNVTEDGTSVIDSLGELVDVNLSGLTSGQILGYDGTEWIPISLDGAISSSVMTGATEEEAGKSGLVPTPQAGDQNKFLRGDGTWAEIGGDGVDTSLFAKQTDLDITNNNVSANTSAINDLNSSNETIIESVTWGSLTE